MRMRTFIPFLFLLLPMASPVSAQDGWTKFPLSSFSQDTNTWSVTAGRDGRVWMVSYWVYTWESWGWRLANPGAPMDKGSISCQAVDLSGNLWVGHGQGISQFDGKAWKHYSMADGLPLPQVFSAGFAPNGDAWFGTDGYISRLRNGTMTTWKLGGTVMSIAVAPDGTVWAGATYKGLLRLDGENWTNIRNDIEAASLRIGADGRIWCAVSGGVSCYDGKKWVSYTMEDGLASARGKIEIAPDGAVWVLNGTRLSVFDGKSWKIFPTPSIFWPRGASSLAFGKNGALWMGSENGVFRYDPTAADIVSQPLSSSEYIIDSFQRRQYSSRISFRDNKMAYVTQQGLILRNTSSGEETLFSSADGLPLSQYVIKDWQSNEIVGLGVAPNGDVWVAATYGIARFDGRSWERFSMLDGMTFDIYPGFMLQHLAIAPNGDVWIGTSRGVARYDGRAWKRFSVADGMKERPINTFAFAPNGDVWVGTDEGPARYDGSSWRVYTAADGITLSPTSYSRSLCVALAIGPDGTVWSVSQGTAGNLKTFTYDITSFSRFDGARWTNCGEFQRGLISFGVKRDGTVWALESPPMGPATYLSLYDGATWKEINPNDDYVNWISLKPLIEGPDNALWGTYTSKLGAGLVRVEGTVRTLLPFLNEFTPGSLFFGPDGNLWGINADGVFCRRDGSFEPVAGLRGPKSNKMNCLALDPNGMLWAGTDSGLSGYDGKEWTNFPAAGKVNALCSDSAGTLWAGGKGIWKRTDGSWKRVGPEDGLHLSESCQVRSLAVTPGDEVVAAVYDSVSFPDAPWKIVTSNRGVWEMNSSGAGELVSIVCTPGGATWFAAKGRIFIYSGGQSALLTPGVDFAGSSIRTLAAAPDGSVWVGTDKGLSRFSDSGGAPKLLGGFLSGSSIRTISPDHAGKVWIGTDEGVQTYDGATWEFFTTKEGLISPVVTALAFHPDGTIWIGTENGLTRMTVTPGSDDSKKTVPAPFAIRGNYPNPFNLGTTIRFMLSQPGHIDLSIYSVAGQKIRTVLSGHMAAGTYSAFWDGRNSAGIAVGSGVYIANLRSVGQVSNHKMLLLK